MPILKILVIEDSPDDALLIQRALQREADIDFAATGQEGLQKASTGQYDAVVLDYKLGDLTGSEVMARLRERKQEVPVIVASGLGSHFIVARTLALGAREFVSKDAPDFGLKLLEALHHVTATSARTLPDDVRKAQPAGKPANARAREIKDIIQSVLAHSDLVNTLGIVGSDGALIQGRIQDKSGAQDVTAVLAGTCQMMLQTVARHLGYGVARSFIASYDKGAIAMAPLPGNLVLFFTSQATPAEIEALRAELEAAASEVATILNERRNERGATALRGGPNR